MVKSNKSKRRQRVPTFWKSTLSKFHIGLIFSLLRVNTYRMLSTSVNKAYKFCTNTLLNLYWIKLALTHIWMQTYRRWQTTVDVLCCVQNWDGFLEVSLQNHRTMQNNCHFLKASMYNHRHIQNNCHFLEVSLHNHINMQNNCHYHEVSPHNHARTPNNTSLTGMADTVCGYRTSISIQVVPYRWAHPSQSSSAKSSYLPSSADTTYWNLKRKPHWYVNSCTGFRRRRHLSQEYLHLRHHNVSTKWKRDRSSFREWHPAGGVYYWRMG